ncbi:MAG: S8 family serine peptidase [Planctomycetaceae bacterium]
MMTSVNHLLRFLRLSLPQRPSARRSLAQKCRPLGSCEAVEARLLLTGNLEDALFTPLVLDEVPADQAISSYLVHFNQAQNTAQLKQATGALSVTASTFVSNAYLFELPQGMTIADAANTFSSLAAFDYLHPNVSQQFSTRSIPNDPLFGDQWHLLNSGQGGGRVGADANIQTVWDNYTGQGVTIGIIDDGLQLDHPDLVANINTQIDYDWNGGDTDPSPLLLADFHGTAVAGVAAGKGDNGIGVSGAAPDAELVGLRLISGPITDQDEAEALTFRDDVIDVYNNSWGPVDDGTISRIGPQALAALQQAATTGRGGLGSIHTWAAGNGGDATHDNVNYDPYANSRFTIAVGALTNSGVRSSYSDVGASLITTAYSNGGTLGITTTDLSGPFGYDATDYTNTFGGTSSATPLVAGVIALMLEANPNLTYRDVTDILVHTGERVDAQNSDWIQNGAGLWVNHEYGFGGIDAAAAVAAAETHRRLGPEESWTSGVMSVAQPINDNAAVTNTITVPSGNPISMEYVELVFNATHSYIGDLEIVLTSPSGTRSVLAETRVEDNAGSYPNWVFTTARNWDESSVGDWTLTVTDQKTGDTGTLNSFELRIYGTSLLTPVVVESAGSTSVEDFGQTDTFDVSLPFQPSSDVVLNVVSQDTTEVTVSNSQLIFTAANWNQPQTVTVTGVTDFLADGDQQTDVVISVAAAASDPAFGGFVDAVVNVTSVDNDGFLPGKPVLTSPSIQPPTGTPVFAWNAVNNGITYSLTVTDVVSGAIVQQTSGLLLRQHVFPAAFANGVYRAVVQASNGSGQVGPASDPLIFAIGPVALPEAPMVTAPTAGQTLNTGTLDVRWSIVPGAFSYEIELTNGGNTTTTIVQGTNLGNGNLSYTFPQTMKEGNSSVRVRALNALNQPGGYSAPVDFIVDAVVAPDRPVIIRPAVAVTATAFPDFQWVSVGGVRFQLWVGRVPDADGSGTVSTLNNRVINLTDYTDTTYRHFLALRNGRYVVWVRSYNSAGEASAWSQGVAFRINVPAPATPVITNFFENNITDPTIEWTTTGDDFPENTTFHLWVNNLSTGQSRVVQETTLSTQSYNFSKLPQGRYGAWVQATSAVGSKSAWSKRFDFVVDLPAPGSVSMTGPANTDGTTAIVSEFPTFTWDASPLAATYELWVNHKTTTTGPVLRLKGIEGTSYTSKEALPEGNLRAWIRPYNAAGEAGDWSAPFDFSLDVPLPALPVITGPATNAAGTVESSTPTITWISSPAAKTYNLELEEFSTQKLVVSRTKLTTESYTVPSSLALSEQAYRVRVQGVNSVGEKGEWTEWSKFTVDVPNAVTPVAYLPVGTVTTNSVTFRWEHSELNPRYEILVRNLLTQTSTVYPVSVPELTKSGPYSTELTLPDGSYRFWVRAFNTENTPSGWSNSKAFVIETVTQVGSPIAPDALNVSLTSLDSASASRTSVSAAEAASDPARAAEAPAARPTEVTSADLKRQPAAIEASEADLAQVMAELADPSMLLQLTGDDRA